MVVRGRLTKRVKKDFKVSNALSGESIAKKKSKKFNKGRKHSHKRKTIRKGEPRDHAHPWLPAGGVKTIDRRPESVAWAKKRREEIRRMREDIPRLRFLFDKEYEGFFRGSFRHFEKAEKSFRLGRKRSEEEIVAEATKDALYDVFRHVIPKGIESYEQFRAETGRYKFNDFREWAAEKMKEARRALGQIK